MSTVLPKPKKLTSIERKQLELKCNNRFNWSDSGNWIGTGRAPNCFIKDDINSVSSHIYRFPTDSSATKWNLEWEKAIRHAGHLGTALLTVGVSAITVGMAGVAVGTFAAIVKDEFQALVPYPRMSRGWSYEIIFKYNFKWSPHPWGQRGLTQTIITISRDNEGKEVNQTSSASKYKLTELPDGLGRMLASALPKRTSSDYQ